VCVVVYTRDINQERNTKMQTFKTISIQCDECGADNAGWPVEDLIVCGTCFESYE